MPPFDATSYLETVVGIVRDEALHATRIDWPRRERALAGDAAAVDGPAAAHAWVRDLLDELDDGHSLLMDAAEAGERAEREPALPRVEVDERAGARHARVVVPWYVNTRRLSGTAFAEALLAGLEAADARPLDGWVVDLRGNGGGNMWPMLAGLAPLLGGSPVGAFRNRAGREHAWETGDGTVGCGGGTFVDIGRPFPALRQARLPLATLAGPGTGSSGEAVVVALRGREGERRFGEPTCGLATANEGFDLPDGATLFLTVARFVDRRGVACEGPIAPDEAVASDGPVPSGDGPDAALEVACRWLAGRRNPSPMR